MNQNNWKSVGNPSVLRHHAIICLTHWITLWTICVYNVWTVRASENVQLLCAFQRAIDEVHTLPLTPLKGGSKTEFVVFWIKFKFSRIVCCRAVLSKLLLSVAGLLWANLQFIYQFQASYRTVNCWFNAVAAPCGNWRWLMDWLVHCWELETAFGSSS